MILVTNNTAVIRHRYNSSLNFDGMDIVLRVIEESTNEELTLTLTSGEYNITSDGFLEIDASALGIIAAMKNDEWYNYIMLIDYDRIYFSKLIKLSQPFEYGTTYSMPLDYVSTNEGYTKNWKTLDND